MVEATQRFKKIVQVGTMNRSRPAIQQAIKFMKDGGIGKVYMARGLCFKPRPSIGKYPDGPMAAGREVQAQCRGDDQRADVRRAVSVEGELRPVDRPRAEAAVQSATASTTTGTGIGTTATATPATRDRTSSTSRGGASASRSTRSRSCSMGGYFGSESSQETPDMQTALFEYADGAILEFGTRGEPTNDEGGQRIGNIFYGDEGLALDRGVRTGCGSPTWDRWAPRTRRDPDRPRQTAEAQGLTTIEFAHYQNFIDAIRSNDPKMLACDIMEGHLTSTLPHLANISYRVGHGLTFNGKTETFENDKAADKLLTREYRKGFEIPVPLVAGLTGGAHASSRSTPLGP